MAVFAILGKSEDKMQAHLSRRLLAVGPLQDHFSVGYIWLAGPHPLLHS